MPAPAVESTAARDPHDPSAELVYVAAEREVILGAASLLSDAHIGDRRKPVGLEAGDTADVRHIGDRRKPVGLEAVDTADVRTSP